MPKTFYSPIELRPFHNQLLLYIGAFCLSIMDGEWLDLDLAMVPNYLAVRSLIAE